MDSESRNARMGWILFAVYLVLYGGFVLLNAFAPDTMDITPLAGINLAVWYGFALIIAAVVLSLIYGVACRTNTAATPNQSATPSAKEGSE